MLPLKDNIPTERVPVITMLLIAINVLVFLYESSLGQGLDRFLATYGMTPYEISHGVSLLPRQVPVFATLFTSMFLHAGILHLGGNMLFLWIFGNNVEDSMGRFRFIIFYFMCGLVASTAQILVDPASQIPNVGASGAIAGVLGGYILLFPRARVTTLVFLGFFITFIELPAALVLFFWMALQVFSGVTGLYSSMAAGGVAYFAHIGGFIVGLLSISFFTMGRHSVGVKRGYLRR
ncbi:MAG: rhomboid family intramembrane serine protease [Thermoleophilia bacterium]